MKEFAITFIMFLVTVITIVFMIDRERIKAKKIRERERKKRAEIREEAQKKIKKIEEEAQQVQCLIDLYKNSITLYNSNPKKFHAYENELIEWYKKISREQSKLAIMLYNNYDISFQNLLTLLEQFAKWTEGKIE